MTLLSVLSRLPQLPGTASLLMVLAGPVARFIQPRSDYYLPFSLVMLAWGQIWVVRCSVSRAHLHRRVCAQQLTAERQQPFFVRLAILISHEGPDKYNNRTPRDYEKMDAAKQSELGPSSAEMLKRSMACHYNTFESFPPFALSVLMCRTSGVPSALVAPVAAQFVLWRALYQVVYVFGKNDLLAYMRTAVFHISTYHMLHLVALAL